MVSTAQGIPIRTIIMDTPQTPEDAHNTLPRQDSQASVQSDKSRGRRRHRAPPASQDEAADASVAEDVENGGSSGVEESGGPRKRRRSRKGLDKKFECPASGCGKSYSRAEHLYRHQLNHTPKQIYHCDWPDCDRTFVRQDLCSRHRERHSQKGQLGRRDSTVNLPLPLSNNVPAMERGPMSPELSRPGGISLPPTTTHLQYPSPPEQVTAPFSPSWSHQPPASISVEGTNGFALVNSANRPGSGHGPLSRTLSSSSFEHRSNSTNTTPGFPGSDSKGRDVYTQMGKDRGSSLDTIISNPTQPHIAGQPSLSNVANSQPTYISPPNFPPFTLPPPGFASTATSNVVRDAEPPYAVSSPDTAVAMHYNGAEANHEQQSGADLMLLDQMAPVVTIPVFGSEGYNRSPYAITDDFMAFLFSNQQWGDIASPNAPFGSLGYPNYLDAQSQQQQQPYLGPDMAFGAYYPPQQHPMAVTSLLDTPAPETILSEEKSQEIIDLIKDRFNEKDHAPVAKQKEALLEGDRSNDTHMMSRKMMETYIGSFWYHFHSQLPILHKPTFSPDKTPNLLLIAMMAIGASCLDKMHGYSITQSGAELANFLAWHLRWEIFSDVHFRPPAKLWVFQALLLLEIYEKMYSTRALHERAHIHHATTITLMRRGSSLIGRSALDSPPSVRDDKQGFGSSRHSSTSGGTHTPDEWWNHWITNEATKRAAFAAFFIDSVHATMFGHSTVMVAHEMRLLLPCDEALWSATSSAEVGRIEASLNANGVKPISFLDGLKRTLSAQEVRTNAFGRSILMAGLLSVMWHMNQRDLQINSLGASQVLGGRDKWRGSLTRAFDLWKQDFDHSLSRTTENVATPYTYGTKQDGDVVFESRTVLHHLAHMAMHVDIVDCQIFARAKRLLGRTIGTQDLNNVKRRMRDSWAPSAKARDATYYAIRFLCTVLLPGDTPSGMQIYMNTDITYNYSARDDVLMNRSWVLYFAALIVWCYSYALEGPTQSDTLSNAPLEDQVHHMRQYLRRLNTVKSPEELKSIQGFNECTGMLMVLRHTFEKTRWELLHEAANLLTNCIRLNSKGTL